jgi:hypothetical protein
MLFEGFSYIDDVSARSEGESKKTPAMPHPVSKGKRKASNGYLWSLPFKAGYYPFPPPLGMELQVRI